MTVFAEPTVTLCGRHNLVADMVCVKRIENGEDHRDPCAWYPMVDIVRRLDHTFTPCKWLHAVAE